MSSSKPRKQGRDGSQRDVERYGIGIRHRCGASSTTVGNSDRDVYRNSEVWRAVYEGDLYGTHELIDIKIPRTLRAESVFLCTSSFSCHLLF